VVRGDAQHFPVIVPRYKSCETVGEWRGWGEDHNLNPATLGRLEVQPSFIFPEKKNGTRTRPTGRGPLRPTRLKFPTTPPLPPPPGAGRTGVLDDLVVLYMERPVDRERHVQGEGPRRHRRPRAHGDGPLQR